MRIQKIFDCKFYWLNIKSIFKLIKYTSRKYQPNSISGIIFSKDRPIQLEALIKSFLSNCKDKPCYLFVLYNCENVFENAYQSLTQTYNNIIFIKENNFRFDLTELLKKIKTDYLFFAVDDMIFIRHFSLIEITNKMNFFSIFSMRLGNRITWCETRQKTMTPNIYIYNDFIEWEWSKNQYQYDWGYQFSVDGNVYKSKEILALTESINFHAPNSYESKMNSFLFFRLKRKGICFEYPIVVNLVLNKVQTEKEFDNLHGNVSVLDLLNLYNQGYRLDLDIISRYDFNSVHKILNEIPLIKIN